jgi:hypothetical protein
MSVKMDGRRKPPRRVKGGMIDDTGNKKTKTTKRDIARHPF